jgi:hypothetical protein
MEGTIHIGLGAMNTFFISHLQHQCSTVVMFARSAGNGKHTRFIGLPVTAMREFACGYVPSILVHTGKIAFRFLHCLVCSVL